MLEYIKRRQKQLEAKLRREAELEAKKEAERIAILEEEARRQEEIVARKKLLREQQEAERLRKKHTQAREKLAEDKWNEQLDTLLAQLNRQKQENKNLEEIKIIIQNRQPSIQELDWNSWLSDPLNQKLADLDFERAMSEFKHDNLIAKRRHGTRGVGRNVSYALAFTGDTAADAAEDHVTTNFNPDTYNLNLGFTVSYWVRPDEVGSTMFAFGRKHSGTQRFVFGIDKANKMYAGVGQNKLTKTWASMGVDSSLLASNGTDLKTDGTWYHFVVTYDDRSDTSSAAARKLYLNGTLLNSANINWSATGGGTGGMYFGGRNLGGGTGYNNGWACALSEVAIFDTAKDADWVADIYNTNGPIRPRTRAKRKDLRNESGLVGYWKFNKGAGTTVTDYSENENHGTFAAVSGDTTAQPTWDSSPFSNS